MHTPLAPLLAALLALAAPPPQQATLTRSPGDNTVTEVGGKTLRQWTDDLKHPDPSVREAAIRAVTLFGADASRCVPQIVERLQDPDSSPRVKAAIALNVMEIRKEEVPAVARALGQRLLTDPQSVVRYYAAVTLNRFGDDARYGADGLVRGAGDTATWEIRHACVAALRTAGKDAGGAPNPAAERALLGALHDPAYQVRLETVMTLGALGRPTDRPLLLTVIKGLQDRLADRDPTVKIWAYVALMALDEVTDKSLQAVVKFLTHKELKVRVNAARGLGTIRNKAKAAVPALTAALQDKEVDVVAAAGWALAQMDELADPAREALLDLLKSRDPAVRAAGAQSFGAAGVKARRVVPALVELVEDKQQPPYVVASACWALGEIGEPTPQAVAALGAVGQRKDADESLKQVAQTALEQIRKLKR